LIPFLASDVGRKRMGCGDKKMEHQVAKKKKAKTCRILNDMEVIDWPPQSPDLNLICRSNLGRYGYGFGCSAICQNFQERCRRVFKIISKERTFWINY
jgi:hypothetical protein